MHAIYVLVLPIKYLVYVGHQFITLTGLSLLESVRVLDPV